MPTRTLMASLSPPLMALLLALTGCTSNSVPVALHSPQYRRPATRVHVVDSRKSAKAAKLTVAEREVLLAQEAFLSKSPGSAERAAALYRAAAAHGNAVAEYNLGVFHEEGIGVHVDRQEAASWYKRAVGNHDPVVHNLANSRLVALFANGKQQAENE